MLTESNNSKAFVSDFSGGMKRFNDPTKLELNEYAYLENGRTRDGVIRPIKKHLLIQDGLPTGKLVQGIYNAGNFELVFIAGECFYKNLDVVGSTFQKLTGFQMSATAEYIYFQPVPASTLNYRRIPATDSPSAIITLQTSGTPSPIAAIVQDGVSQPRIILPDGSVRLAQTFDQWSLNDDKREYIPVGLMMLYYDGITYIVSPNRRTIYRSVRGRPFDFVVAVTSPDGDKLNDGIPVEAERLSHNVDYEEITAIKSLAIDTGGFFVGTRNSSYVVVPDYTELLFGQPQFRNIPFLSTGPLNQFSVVDLLGDTALINESGIRSFNAIRQTKNEGGSLPFHSDIAAFFENPSLNVNIIQDVACCESFSDYTFFAVNTVYGYGVLVYDNQRKVYVSFDRFADIGAIKGMSVIKRNRIRKLFFYDINNNVYEAFASPTTAECKSYIREWTTGDVEAELKPNRFRVVLQDIKESGTLYATDYTDRKSGSRLSKSVVAVDGIGMLPLTTPFGPSDKDTCKNLTFAFQKSRKGWKAGVLLELNFMADISYVGLVSTVEESATSTEEQAKEFRQN